MKQILILLIVVIVIGGVVFFLTQNTSDQPNEEAEQEEVTEGEASENEGEVMVEDSTRTVLGSSVEERDIVAYHYGTGDTELLFVGGIHGGYSPNTTLVARRLMEYLDNSPDVIPENVKVTVVPLLNPDGLFETLGTTDAFTVADIPTDRSVTISGRFNANGVDLNRNFACDWQAKGRWQSREVSGGAKAFSEPESVAIRSYVEAHKPEAVVVWYSAAGAVFASSCGAGVLAETAEILDVYADASGYPSFQTFDFYQITGDFVNWLAKENIAGISVLLTNHRDTEWDKNKAGIEALFVHYAN